MGEYRGLEVAREVGEEMMSLNWDHMTVLILGK